MFVLFIAEMFYNTTIFDRLAIIANTAVIKFLQKFPDPDPDPDYH